MRVEVRTQAELEAAIAAGNTPVCTEGRFVVTASMGVEAIDSSSVVALGFSSVVARNSSSIEALGFSRVEAMDSSSVVAWESSTVLARDYSSVAAWDFSRVVALGSSRVEAMGSSRVVACEASSVMALGFSSVVSRNSSRVVAMDSSSVEAMESSRVEARGLAIIRVTSCASVVASAMVTVVIEGCGENVSGGNQIKVKHPETALEWCEHYGVEIEGDTAILFKGVNDKSYPPHGADHTPGSIPLATDWDGCVDERCSGLHFSPHPAMTLEFHSGATRFLACPVLLSGIAVPPRGMCPQIVRAAGCCAPVWEVDRDGKRVENAK
jgi:hypothetical protein